MGKLLSRSDTNGTVVSQIHCCRSWDGELVPPNYSSCFADF
jgi:hypothetical protein